MSEERSNTAHARLLPEGFEDLEEYAGWALPTEQERRRKRQTSDMTEIESFYRDLLPRMDAIFGYLNEFPLDAMPEDAGRLFHITLSLAEIAPAVEFYKQQEVVAGFPADRFVPVDILPRVSKA